MSCLLRLQKLVKTFSTVLIEVARACCASISFVCGNHVISATKRQLKDGSVCLTKMTMLYCIAVFSQRTVRFLTWKEDSYVCCCESRVVIVSHMIFILGTPSYHHPQPPYPLRMHRADPTLGSQAKFPDLVYCRSLHHTVYSIASQS